MKKKEQHYRVSDFENAIRKSDLNIQVSIINYLPDSLYVKEIVGFVEQHDRGIRVTWNNKGATKCSQKRAVEMLKTVVNNCRLLFL